MSEFSGDLRISLEDCYCAQILCASQQLVKLIHFPSRIVFETTTMLLYTTIRPLRSEQTGSLPHSHGATKPIRPFRVSKLCHFAAITTVDG